MRPLVTLLCVSNIYILELIEVKISVREIEHKNKWSVKTLLNTTKDHSSVKNMVVRALGFLIVLWCHEINCKKIVVLPLQTRSRVYPILPVARALANYNHSVTFVLSSSLQMELMADSINIPHIIAASFNRTRLLEATRAVLENAMTGSTFTAMINSVKEYYYQCQMFMEDMTLYEKLKAEKFDYAIVSFAHVTCFEVMAYKLSVPFVYISAHVDLALYRVPFLPSFMPSMFSGFTDKMTFTQRTFNTISYIFHLLHPTMPSVESLVAKYAGDRPSLSNSQLKMTALLHIVDSDVLMDFSLPLPPNVIFCGGLATRDAKNLPKYMLDFSQTFDGLVVVTFGSIVTTIEENVFNKFIAAFHKIKQLGFIVRSGNTMRQYKNVLFAPWLPQNDLLGYKTTKLFITHCGKSGIFEALYHGAMVGFPLGYDQFSNAAVIVDKGYGISMDIMNFSVDELIENIRKVIYTDYYRANITRASSIFHSRPQTPSKRAEYWIDLVSKYGSEQFRSYALDMPWYSYYMVDLYLLFFILIILVKFSKRFIKTYSKSSIKKKIS